MTKISVAIAVILRTMQADDRKVFNYPWGQLKTLREKNEHNFKDISPDLFISGYSVILSS